MKVFRVDEIALGPIDIIAEDRTQVLRIFICALIDGLQRYPGADFDVSDWTSIRLKRFPRVQRWVAERRAGVIWPTRYGDDWEHVAYNETGD